MSDPDLFASASFSPDDIHYMRRALALTRRGLGISSPNPAVGALVVKDGHVVGQGVHLKAGTPHGEARALAMAGEQARGADLYVTLEPCNHTGRTPPCTRAILEAGVKRVVYGASDPNPGVAGGGGAFLADNGLQVAPGCLGAACRHEHRFFLTHITSGRPHVILKTAATLDGKTATRTGSSRWVTGPNARRFVHRMRSWCDAICVGIGTVLADDPELTSRLPGGRDPLRLVVDRHLRTPPDSRVLASGQARCLIACGEDAPQKALEALSVAGAEILPLPLLGKGLDLETLLDELGRRGVTSLFLEGGAVLAWSFLERGLIDEVMYFFAPKLAGGEEATPMLGGEGVELMSQAIPLGPIHGRRFNPDILLWARVAKS